MVLRHPQNPRNWLPDDHPLKRGGCVIFFHGPRKPAAPPAPNGDAVPTKDEEQQQPAQNMNAPASMDSGGTAMCCSPTPSRLFQKGDRVFLHGAAAIVEEDQLPGQEVLVREWAPCCVGTREDALRGTLWNYPASELRLLPPLPPQPVSEPEVAPVEAEGPPAEPPVPGPVQGTLPFSEADAAQRAGGAS